MLEIKNVSKSFGGIQALNNVNMVIEEGKITSLIGPNGAGKTTLFNAITGTIPPDSGKIEFLGEEITGMRSYEISRKGITRTYQQKNVFPNLSVFENVYAGMLKDELKRSEKEEEVYQFLDFLGLSDKTQHVVSELPPLEIKLVELGRSLAAHPKLLLLDELVGGLIASETGKICEKVETLKDRGYTIFQIGHEMGPILGTSDWAIVLDKGAKLAEGTSTEIRKNEDVKAVYLESSG